MQDAQEQGISHWLVIPCLVLTLMFGPVGLAVYLLLRFIVARKLIIYEATA